MKKIILLFIGIILLSISNYTFAISCDKNFENNYVRFNMGYTFFDDAKNVSTNARLYVNAVTTDYINASYLNAGGDFKLTEQLRNSGFGINPGETMRIISTTAPSWKIIQHPLVRTSSTIYNYDFMISYALNYDYSNNYPDTSDDRIHTECQYFSVTWCGDGVRDAGYEVCDPNDPTRTGWGPGGCDITCNQLPAITCNSLVANPNSGTVPLISTLSCNGNNASSYKIDIKNSAGTVIHTINNQEGDYNFTTKGDYTASCYVNGNITSTSCSTPITIRDNPPPPTTCNSLTATPNSGTAPLNSVLSCNGTNASSYKIDIKNGSGVVINTINGQTGNYSFNNIGNYSATCYVNGSISAPACSTPITVSPTPPPTTTCNSLVATPNSGFPPLTSSFSCNGNNASNYKIDIKNGSGVIINTINSQTGTYLFVSTGSYSATCYVNGTISSPSCNAPVNVGISGNLPACNSLTATPNGGLPPLTSSFSCAGTNASNYKIDIKNSAGAIINTINSQTGTYLFASTGSYNATCYVNGTVSSQSCNAPINVGFSSTGSTCESLSATPSSGSTPFTSTFSCNGNNVSNYKINITDSAGNILNTINGSTGSYYFSNEGSYSANCYINGSNTTPASCSKTISLSLGGGEVRADCKKIEVENNTSVGSFTTNVKCIGSDRVDKVRIYCKGKTGIDDTNYIQVDSLQNVQNSTDKYGTVSCSYDSSSKNYSPSCEAHNNIGSDPAFYTVSACKTNVSIGYSGGYGGGGNCGDGVLQKGSGEECERIVTNGIVGNFPSFCDSSCKVKTLTYPGGGDKTCKGCLKTYPNEGQLIFGPEADIVIGHLMNPFNVVLVRPFIKNDSDYELHFDKLCVKQTSGTTLDTIYGNKTKCEYLPDILSPGEKFEFSYYPIFTGNKNNIPGYSNYGDNNIITTIENGGNLYENAYFNANLKVRVSKPSISTTGGGTSYVKKTTSIADLNDVSKKANNKNFVGTSVGTGGISSYSKNVVNSSSVTKVGDTSNNYSGSINKITNNQTSITTTNTSSFSDFKKYNGLSNVFILKNKNFVLNNSNFFDNISGATTFIIENGNFTISKDITYSDNIAFIVKGGNINISGNVKQINGTYITIANSNGGGRIMGEESQEQLKVNGSLYGDLDGTGGLVDNRVYISEDLDQLNVGTIVSFGSSIFRKTAPLTGQFISEYLKSKKVAQ